MKDYVDTKSYADPGPSYFGDVPLKIAMLGWCPTHRTLVGVKGRILVIPRRDDRIDWWRYFGVTDSTLACWHKWEGLTKNERLLKLYIEMWHIIARDGLKPEDVHSALMVIPEYRATLSGETFFSWTKPNPATDDE